VHGEEEPITKFEEPYLTNIFFLMMDHTSLVRNVEYKKTYVINPKEISDKEIRFPPRQMMSSIFMIYFHFGYDI
jgi:hypothetical protein